MLRSPLLRSLIATTACFAPMSSGLAQLPPVPQPPGNPTTPDKVNLGKALFWDEQMSSTGTVACGTCHRPDAGGTDPRAPFSVNPGPDGLLDTEDDIHASPGVPFHVADGTYQPHAVFGFDVQVTGRTAPSMINAAFNPEQFWDGRAGSEFKDPLTGAVVLPDFGSLESQASGPPLSDVEMANVGRGWQDVADRIAASQPLALATDIPPALATWLGTNAYPQLFQRVFGDNQVTPARIVMAIAAYERTLISDETPFDLGMLTSQQQVGLDIFNEKGPGGGRCTFCHENTTFRDFAYHNTGLRPIAEDTGRFDETGNPFDRGAFKTPGIRNSSLRKVFMHNGQFTSLAEVIEFYDRGGDFTENLDPSMQVLSLSVPQKVAMLDFLENGLTDPRVVLKLPPFDRPTLFSETLREPQMYGFGLAGSGGVEPRLFSVEPPLLGNQNLTVTVHDGLGGAFAVLAADQAQFGPPFLGVPMMIRGTPATQFLPLGSLQGSGDGQGYWSGALRMPRAPALAGTTLYLQAFVLDAGAAQGLAGTGGLSVTLF
ncbi:MAG: cytochrome c peroxidase [Planctomycetota bacterium]